MKLKKLYQTALLNFVLDSCGYKPWFISIKNIFPFLKMDHILYTSDVKEIELNIKSVKKTAKVNYKSLNDNELQFIRYGRLSFYTQVVEDKDKQLQPYLTNRFIPSKFRKAITRFRISDHKSPIETGQYYFNIDRSDKICPMCCSGRR